MIKNFKTYNQKKYRFKYKALVLGVSSLIAVTASSGCSKKVSYDEYSLTAVNDSINHDDSITKIDEYVDSYISQKEETKNLGLEDIDEMFNEAYNEKDRSKCNECLKIMSEAIVYSMIVEGYNFDVNKISDYEIIGNVIDCTTDGYTNKKTEYGVKFNYDGKDYKVKAEGLARDICCISRAGLKRQLEFDNSHFEYLIIDNAYNLLKETLLKDLEYDTKKTQEKISDFGFGKYYGLKFDGKFEFVESEEKEEEVHKYLKK